MQGSKREPVLSGTALLTGANRLSHLTHCLQVVLADIAVGKSIVHVIDYPLFQGLPKTKA